MSSSSARFSYLRDKRTTARSMCALESVRVAALSCGQTRAPSKASGAMIRQTVEDVWSMQMEASMRVTGSMGDTTAMAFSLALKVWNIMVTGATINKMARAKKAGQTAPSTWVTMLEVRKLEKGSLAGQMGRLMRAPSLTVSSKASAYIPGHSRVASTPVTGKRAECMDRAPSNTQMAEYSTVHLPRARSMVVAASSGPMVANTEVPIITT